ncbi:YAP1 redox domain-containing protein [Metschnikowia bicuspidata var. bicuspidata NRRL YB-4993]|uniref:YAP1 redox domain-containing protein n=1 Tax=Metschnikowia bicuspidata var. bicuspidata NRRL YB-4993 TaxID=869754 RepID=A0A1A0H7Z5_9ASCO|nr:YAP1 redox domain-containing protein [Metschnikowia bicuspidata var. bicuspidata NRRL YB-4993]OBA20018.1 YAP1 redox domain-containing protein [Metschnikowia bicuspidata var. bicuspidata NRRL YB-4993]
MLDTKRPIDEESPDFSSHDDKKQHTKPGRKPIDTEPKSKRTAQNRAAQRAYRERKERKMKDLEDKVSLLEDDKMKAEAQIELLKSELSRYRGHSDFSDLKPLSNARVKRESSESGLSLSDFTVGFPWAKKQSADSEVRSNASSNHLPDLTSGSSSSNSPLNENVIVSPHSNSSDNYSVPSSGLVDLRHTTSSLFDEELNPFCTSLNEACGTRLKPIPKFHRDSQSFPLQQDTKASALPQSYADSPFQSLFTPNLDLQDPLFNSTGESSFNFSLDNLNTKELPTSLFNDANFDINLALGNLSNDPIEKNIQNHADVDSLAGVVSEESAYDPFNHGNTDFNFNEFVKSSYSASESSRNNSVMDGNKTASSVTSFNSPAIPENEEKEVVPAPPLTMECSEIWDRITAHPRYTEIDIDGLCAELKAKAKCSEQGVVLNADDVSTLIERSANKR